MDVEAIGEITENRLGANQELGKDEFLKLMVAQLNNQDPLNPTTNEDFLAQLAQFSSLEQMRNLNESFTTFSQSIKLGNASSLIGKDVTHVNMETGEIEVGKVDQISLRENQVYVTANGKEFLFDDIRSIKDNSIIADEND